MSRTKLVNGMGTGAAAAAIVLIGSAGGGVAFSAQPPSGLKLGSVVIPKEAAKFNREYRKK